MPIDLAALTAAYEAEYVANSVRLAALAGQSSYSVEGQSQSFSSGDLLKRQEWLEIRLAALGAPVGDIAVPFAISGRARAW